MQFNSDRKRIDQTWVNVKKAKAIVKEFTSKNNGTQPTANNSAYAALAQAWRKLADESTDAKYQAVLYGCVDDLCQLNAGTHSA